MKNPSQYCTRCQAMHNNPVIDLFNQFLKATCTEAQPPPDYELDMYRAYVAGQHDCFSVVIKASEYQKTQAEYLVNQIAICIRDATLAGMPEPELDGLKAKVRAAITKRFFIREDRCHHGN